MSLSSVSVSVAAAHQVNRLTNQNRVWARSPVHRVFGQLTARVTVLLGSATSASGSGVYSNIEQRPD